MRGFCFVLNELEDDTRFSNSRVSDYNEFEEVVIGVHSIINSD